MAAAPRSQILSIVVALIFGSLGLLASTGFTPRLAAPLAVVLLVDVVLAVAGFAAGAATIRRRVVLDQERWEIVEQDGLTSGERQLAHREADRQIRIAGAIYFAAAVAPGAWLSYQMRDPAQFTSADLSILAPVLGFVLGLVIQHRRTPARFQAP